MQHSEKALSLLPPDCLSERAYAVVFGSGAHQMCGDLDRAHTLIRGHLADTSLPLGTFQVRLERGQCFMHWVAADLPSLRSAIKRVRELSERLELAESLKLASYLCGIVDYQLNRLAQAETILASLVTIGKPPNLEFYAQSAFALASVYQASGRAKKARETATSLCEYLLDIGNSSLLQLAQAYRADLAVRQGRLGEGLEWARRFVPQPFGPRPSFFRTPIGTGQSADCRRRENEPGERRGAPATPGGVLRGNPQHPATD